MDTAHALTSFEVQARACRGLGAPLCADLLESARDDFAAGGAVASLCEDFEGDPGSGFLALRVLAAVHRRVLEGAAPRLAAHYPTAGGAPRWPDAGAQFLAVVAGDAESLRPQLREFPQTNEVARSGALLAGFLDIARQTDMPLRLCEIGASAGLNLRFDRFRYALGEQRWGDPESPVLIESAFEVIESPDASAGGVPVAEIFSAPERLEVVSRRGCDIAPIDTADPAAALRLCSYVWADQVDRLARLRAAIEVARAVPAQVERASAAEWLERELAAPSPGAATVVFHSVMWAYLPESEQRAVAELMRAAGERATAAAPLAWLQLDQGEFVPRLRLQTWPGGPGRDLADGHPHGTWIHWLQPPAE